MGPLLDEYGYLWVPLTALENTLDSYNSGVSYTPANECLSVYPSVCKILVSVRAQGSY